MHPHMMNQRKLMDSLQPDFPLQLIQNKVENIKIKIYAGINGGTATLVSQSASKTKPSCVYNIKAKSGYTEVKFYLTADSTNYTGNSTAQIKLSVS